MTDDEDSAAIDEARLAPAPGYRTMVTPPDGFVHRRELDEVRALLCAAAEDGGAVGITTALRGAGGFGKTTLAQALAFDDEVRAAYPDGVLWATMGDGLREGDRLARVQGLVEWWGSSEKGAVFSTLEAARAHLAGLLDGRRVLIVVDDVWQSADVETFRGAATLLVTTRYGQTLPAECRRVDVDAMASSEAVELLASGLDVDEPARFAALARRLGEWPLLLRLVNRQLRELAAGGLDAALREVEDELDEAGVTAFDVEDDSAREKAVARTFEVGLRHLGAADRGCFEEFAVFPEDADVPLAVVERLWGLRPAAARKLCGRFHDLSLLLRFDRQARTIRLHDVVRQYLMGLQGDAMPRLHGRLLERNCPESGNWTQLPRDEQYLWRHLADHLVEADRRDALRELLFDFGYLSAKIAATGVNALMGDYDVLGEDGRAFGPSLRARYV